jgi:hypothetical protein
MHKIHSENVSRLVSKIQELTARLRRQGSIQVRAYQGVQSALPKIHPNINSSRRSCPNIFTALERVRTNAVVQYGGRPVSEGSTASTITGQLCTDVRDRSLWWPTPGYVNVFGNMPMSASIRTNGYPSEVQMRQLRLFNVPDHQIPSLWTADDFLISTAIRSFREAALQMIAAGNSIQDVLGSDPPSVDLLFRDRTSSDLHSVSHS